MGRNDSVRLEGALALPAPEHLFPTDPFYGSATEPAYRVGYYLANTFRSELGFNNQPIDSMRDLLERRLRIPIIQAELGVRIAGATVASSDRRAIVVNLSGRNQNVFARRSTLWHMSCVTSCLTRENGCARFASMSMKSLIGGPIECRITWNNGPMPSPWNSWHHRQSHVASMFSTQTKVSRD